MSRGKPALKGLAALSVLKSDPAPKAGVKVDRFIAKPAEPKLQSPTAHLPRPAPTLAPARPTPGAQPGRASPTVGRKSDVDFRLLPDAPMPPALSKPATSAEIAPEDLKGGAALSFVLKAIHDVRFSIAEARPTSCPADVQALIQRRIALGAGLMRRDPEPDEEGFIVGVDFGTSSTKIILHQPFAAGDPAVALPVPEILRSEGIEHLWQTAVWFEPRAGMFSLFPTSGATPIEGFKAGMIQRLGGYADAAGVPRCLAATAYLAQLFAYVLGYYEETRPLGSVGAKQFAAFHLGVPVATKDDGRALAEFWRVAASAFALIARADRLTLSLVKAAFGEAAHADADLRGVRLYTELEGIIAGYLATPGRAPGAHMAVDVGASTLDVATFRIYPEDGEMRTNIYAAGVEMLGAQALQWAKAADVPEICFKRAGWHHAWSQFHHTRTKKDYGFDRTRSREPVRFLFVGGGRLSVVHQAMFQQAEKDLYLGAPSDTPTPSNASVWAQDVDFSRLLVAYGLSRDRIQIPTIRLPSEMEDEPGRARDFTDKFPSKDVAQ